MLKIKKEHVIYEMSEVNPPAARARSGEQVCFETMDCYGETIRSEQDTVSLVPWKVINPATGPLYVEGALLAVGDLHAAMGDGEVVICGVETSGEVIVQVDVIKDFSAPLPLLVSRRRVMTIASAETLDQAAAQATENMARFLTERLELDIAEVGMLMSAACDLRICQIADPLVTVRMECPEQILKQYGVMLP